MDLGRVRLWSFCLNKYAHNGPFNGVISFGFPGFIFQAQVTKFGANVGLNMLIDISPRFYHIRKKTSVANVFRIFQQQKALKRL